MGNEERKILEFAAKALGFTYVEGESWDDNAGWNSLHYSADCAAMCAKLFIDSDWYKNSIRMATPFDDNDEQHESWEDFKDYNNDRESAWRYAATMVAARIGGFNGD